MLKRASRGNLETFGLSVIMRSIAWRYQGVCTNSSKHPEELEGISGR